MDATTTPINLPTTKQATLFKEEQASEDAAEAQREHDRKVDLMITPKKHQLLRAMGYDVVYTGESKGPSTSDRRSL